jgi:hypothetical protein
VAIDDLSTHIQGMPSDSYVSDVELDGNKNSRQNDLYVYILL